MMQLRYSLSRKAMAVFCVISALILQGGCASLKETFNFTSIDEDGNEIQSRDINLPAKKLIEQGMADYEVGKYFTAIEFFEEILNKFPFSKEATLAELKAADCSYYLGRYAEALLLYEEFENRHPTNESIPYVMFQKAMCNYKQIDRVDRDTTGAEKSIALFRQLLKAYPNTPYTEEAKSRIENATEFLANHEFVVIQYYTRTAKYDEAKVRINYLLSAYPDSLVASQAKDLLARIEAGDPPRSRLTSWFPKVNLPDWTLFGRDDAENTTVDPTQR
ncbi:outer membrane protein assembly factor BamD [Desulforhopalus sp. IMCC35007]|uniref:outer membrane protein assembly factor BamD n=1 Tax=Desulforhopalus sp. IMCC35007 TaxID=2569543 RepID=UPI001F0D27B6|nr:outer membrane protein assembly factor BamD [Desulforhopalus sp. IMCC35007]